jgi:hypothetical protein
VELSGGTAPDDVQVGEEEVKGAQEDALNRRMREMVMRRERKQAR